MDSTTNELKLLSYPAPWYQNDAGRDYLAKHPALEDRILFVYSYLRKVAHPSFDEKDVLWKMAFFLADGVYGSALPYGAFPDFLDAQKNPFIAYLKSATFCPEELAQWPIFASILHETVDPQDKNAWIYKNFSKKAVRAALNAKKANGNGGEKADETTLVLGDSKTASALNENDAEYYRRILTQAGCKFCFIKDVLEPLDRFDIQEELRPVQIKLAWFFATKGRGA